MCHRADAPPSPRPVGCCRGKGSRARPAFSRPGPASSPPTDYTRARPFAPVRRPGCQLRIISRGGTTPLCQRDPPDRGPALPVRPSTVTARAFGASIPSGRDPSRGPKPRRACWETIEGRRPRGHARMQVPSKCRPRGAATSAPGAWCAGRSGRSGPTRGGRCKRSGTRRLGQGKIPETSPVTTGAAL